MNRTPPFLLAVALLLAAAPLPAAVMEDDVLSTVEDTALDFTLDQLTANDSPGIRVASLSRPERGSVSCRGEVCTYTPARGFTGIDSFGYSAIDEDGGGDARVRVQVAPLVLPLAGDWNGDGLTDLGWFQGRYQDVFLFLLDGGHTAGPQPGPHSCTHLVLPPAAAGWIPLVGDWNGDRRSDLGLYEPSEGRFHLFRREVDAWLPDRTVDHPYKERGGLPLVGDWNGDGLDDVGLYLPDGHRFLLLRLNWAGAEVAHDFSFKDLPHGPWLPVAGDWYGDGTGIDVVGVWNPEDRILRLGHANAEGPTYQPEDYRQEGPGLLPFSGRWEHPVSIGFYDPAASGGRPKVFVLYPQDFNHNAVNGGRWPILLPPPEDPAVTPCTIVSL